MNTSSRIRFLRELSRHSMTAGQLGSNVWGTPARSPQSYVRPACKLLYQLQREGLVAVRVDDSGKVRTWHLTVMGQRLVQEGK